MLVDSHAHLDDRKYDADLAEVLKRARKQEIKFVINSGYNEQASRRGLQLAEAYEEIYAAVGIHPHEAKEATEETFQFLRNTAQHKKVVALGEMGLDYYRNLSPREQQQDVFRRQIALARELKMPIIVHDRNAHEDVLSILQSEKAREVGGVIHCFSGDWKMARQCMDMGFFLSLAGPVTFKNAGHTAEMARLIPLNRLLIETDSPYLSPEPFRGKRNEPAHVRLVAAKIAALRKIDLQELGNITTSNALRLFGLPTK